VWSEWLVALSLVLVLEGIIPFVYPQRWRQLVALLAQQSDKAIRISGLVSMLIGLGLLMIVR